MNPDEDRWVRMDEARAKLRDLIDDVTSVGAHIYVLRYDKPVAVIVPVDWYEEMKRRASRDGGEESRGQGA